MIKILMEFWWKGFKMLLVWVLAMVLVIGVISLGARLFELLPLLAPILIVVALIIFVPLVVYALAN